MERNSRYKNKGFSLLEVGLVAAGLALLAAIILPPLSESRKKSRNALCQNNLRQINYSFEVYAQTDRNGYLPFSGSADRNEKALVPWAQREFKDLSVFVCPEEGSDGRKKNSISSIQTIKQNQDNSPHASYTSLPLIAPGPFKPEYKIDGRSFPQVWDYYGGYFPKNSNFIKNPGGKNHFWFGNVGFSDQHIEKLKYEKWHNADLPINLRKRSS